MCRYFKDIAVEFTVYFKLFERWYVVSNTHSKPYTVKLQIVHHRGIYIFVWSQPKRNLKLFGLNTIQRQPSVYDLSHRFIHVTVFQCNCRSNTGWLIIHMYVHSEFWIFWSYSCATNVKRYINWYDSLPGKQLSGFTSIFDLRAVNITIHN